MKALPLLHLAFLTYKKGEQQYQSHTVTDNEGKVVRRPGQTPGAGEGQGGLACCDSWGHIESDTTERLI